MKNAVSCQLQYNVNREKYDSASNKGFSLQVALSQQDVAHLYSSLLSASSL